MTSFTSARLQWLPPEENADVVVGYRVHYQETDIHAYYNSVSVKTLADLLDHFHGLVQDRRNSSANALTHWFVNILSVES